MRRRIMRSLFFASATATALVLAMTLSHADTINVEEVNSTNFSSLNYPSTPAVSTNNGGNSSVNGLFWQSYTQSQLNSIYSANVQSPYGTTGNSTLLYNYFGGGSYFGNGPAYSAPTNESATFNIGAQTLDFLWADPTGDETLQLFSGANGTGTLLDTINNNNLTCNSCGSNEIAFLTAVDLTEDIGSMIVSVNNGNSGFAFAFDPPPDDMSATPLPSTLILMLGGLASLLGFAWVAQRSGEHQGMMPLPKP